MVEDAKGLRKRSIFDSSGKSSALLAKKNYRGGKDSCNRNRCGVYFSGQYGP